MIELKMEMSDCDGTERLRKGKCYFKCKLGHVLWM